MTYPLATSSWGKEELYAIQEVMDKGRFTMGPAVKKFEEEFADMFGQRIEKGKPVRSEAVMVNSGSTANLMMLSLLRWKHGMKRGNVIVPTIGWSTTYFPIFQNNFLPNFVDVDPETYNMDTSKIEEAITNQTVAIMPVNLCGNPCDFGPIKEICKKHNLLLIEDNCESMGAMWNSDFTGSIGDMGSFSFFFSHHIQTMEGGMILCRNKDDADYIRSMRAHGWCRDFDNDNLYKKTGNFFKDSFTFVTPGYSVRPVEMSGAIGSVQLKKWDDIVNRRLKNAGYFKQFFDSEPWLDVQQVKNGVSTWFSFGCVLNERLKGRRDDVIKAFDENGIEARPLASGHWLKQPVMKDLDYIDMFKDYPASQNIDENGFWIGNHATDMSLGIEKVHEVLKKVADAR